MSANTPDSNTPLPLAELSPAVCKNLRGILADIDDTISLDGKIPEAAYSALWRAKEAGLRVIPVTGRPAGWVDHIARMWPVDAVVGENGAFYFYLDSTQGRDGKLIERFVQDRETRRANHQRLFELFQELKLKIPQAQLASDQGYRAIDVAVDFCEDVPRLSDRAISEIVTHFKQAGAQAKISSIHVNAWFGDHNKYECCRLLFAEQFSEALDEVKDHYLYVGDSPNDEPFFAEFPNSVGVANAREFLDLMQFPPAFLTTQAGGLGFAELVDHILNYR